jgi:hypothetical protein
MTRSHFYRALQVHRSAKHRPIPSARRSSRVHGATASQTSLRRLSALNAYSWRHAPKMWTLAAIFPGNHEWDARRLPQSVIPLLRSAASPQTSANGPQEDVQEGRAHRRFQLLQAPVPNATGELRNYFEMRLTQPGRARESPSTISRNGEVSRCRTRSRLHCSVAICWAA